MVEKLQNRRSDTQPAQSERSLQGFLLQGESRQKGSGYGGLRNQSQGNLGDHSQRTLAPDPQVAQIVARGELAGRPAPLHLLSRGQKTAEGQHVVACHPVLHAPQPARIAGNVAPDRAKLLRRGIRRIKQPHLLRLPLDVSHHRSRLGHAGALLLVYGKTVQRREVQHPTTSQRRGTAGQGRTHPARGHGNGKLVRQPKNLPHLRILRGGHHGVGGKAHLHRIVGNPTKVLLLRGSHLAQARQQSGQAHLGTLVFFRHLLILVASKAGRRQSKSFPPRQDVGTLRISFGEVVTRLALPSA